MSEVTIRPVQGHDRGAIFQVEARAFGQQDEAKLVDQLAADGATVLELVAEKDGRIVGHVLFSRLMIEADGKSYPAVALAPLAVDPDYQGQGIGAALVETAHERLKANGETLSIVLGDPAYYDRFGYAHARAAGFDSAYQGEALQALAWGDASATGRLVYAAAFSAL